jgi:NTP pyrophosphatase (non-canonical NTP hydrolase)
MPKPRKKERRISRFQQYAIGSDHLPGLSKLVEEMGETGQIVGKIMGLGHMGEHWDGKEELRIRLQNELADLMAAVLFVNEKNYLDAKAIRKRTEMKLKRFNRWHANVQAGRDPNDNGDKKK